MKSHTSNLFAKSLLLGTGSLALAVTSQAADLTWDNGAATGNWNITDQNWSGVTPWSNSNPDSAIFGSTAAGLVALTEGITVKNITFDAAGYTVSGNTLTVGSSGETLITTNQSAAISSDLAGGTLRKSGSATLILSGANTYSGGTVIENGTLEVDSMADGTGSIGSAWLAIDNSATLRYTGTGSESTNRDIWINNAAGTRTFDIVDAGATLTLASSGGSIIRDIQKTGDGTLALGRVTSDGNTTISAGLLEVTTAGKLYGSGYTITPTITVETGATLRLNGWSWDAAGSIANLDYGRDRLVVNGGTLEYTGISNFNPGDPGSSSRNLTIGSGGATLKASSTAGQTWTLHSANGNLINNESLTLDGTGAGEIQKVIEGSGTVTKSGTGTWTLSGANSYTGNTTINGGILILADDAQLTFSVGDSSQNTVGGAGTATFNGDFNINTSAVTGAAGGIWLLVDRANLTGESFDPVTFNVIGFTQQGDGVTWTMSDAKGDWSFSEDTGELTLDVGSDYDVWVTANGVVGTETDDDDNDGLTNFEEYAFGLDPTGGSSVNPITSQLDKATKKFSYTRRATNLPDPTLTYSVWFSTDLGTWTQDTGATEGTPVLNGEVETVEVTLSALPGDPLPGKLFIQVRAE